MQVVVLVALLFGMRVVWRKHRRDRQEEIATSIDGPTASCLVLRERQRHREEAAFEERLPEPRDDRFLRHHVKPPKNYRLN